MHESEIRVMLVDDHQTWTQLVRSTLHNKNGFTVVCEVSDGISAVARAEELQPDLIILDIGLPELNGIESSRRIARLAPKSSLPAIKSLLVGVPFISKQDSPPHRTP